MDRALGGDSLIKQGHLRNASFVRLRRHLFPSISFSRPLCGQVEDVPHLYAESAGLQRGLALVLGARQECLVDLAIDVVVDSRDRSGVLQWDFRLLPIRRQVPGTACRTESIRQYGRKFGRYEIIVCSVGAEPRMRLARQGTSSMFGGTIHSLQDWSMHNQS